VLLERGMVPAAVVALDAQQISYHHVLTAGVKAQDIPVIADLSTPPTVLRHSGPPLLATTGYPLAQLLAERLEGMQTFDGAGGNVTQAAVSAAAHLGATRIHVMGADLAYPQGMPYARDCYVYPYFRSVETRMRPVQTRIWEMVQADPDTAGTYEDGRRVYHTPKLDAYHRRFETASEHLDAEVVLGPPSGGSFRPGRSITRRVSIPPRGTRRQALEEVRERTAELPLPGESQSSDFRSFAAEDRRLWMALLPSAAAFLSPELDARNTGAVLEQTKAWALSRLSRAL
jgi:hypothetical protein